MPDNARKLLTIVTESVLEDQICRELKDLGATGYTVTDARGSGSRGIRDAGWSSAGNVRIEVVCEIAVAERISVTLQKRYYDDYAMIIFVSDVAVLRPDKFM
jgi:hypothetical protein